MHVCIIVILTRGAPPSYLTERTSILYTHYIHIVYMIIIL